MRYATLSNSQIHYAPNPIKVGSNYIGNPPDAVYVEAGYLPVVTIDPPETDARHYAELHWVERGGSIMQEWEIVEIPATDELSPDEALSIILGGAE